jgi:hypothetical protein
MKLSIILMSIVFGVVGVLAQGATKAEKEHSADVHKTIKTDVTYGRVKELTPGKKIAVDVDNSPDKSFDLTDKDTTVTLAKGLSVGDPVKVIERKANGKNAVRIVRDTRSDVKHGDKTSAQERRDAPKK